jgi:chromosome condensin MukBEF complex kleisin-like MukF subunit
MSARRRPIAVLVLGALALAGCGGSDEKDAQQTVRDFAKAVNDTDGKTFCNKLVTRKYVEDSTQAKGKQATDLCIRQIDGLQGQRYEVVKFTKTKIDGDKARVSVRLKTNGVTREQQFNLQKEDGDFRLTAATP